MVQDCLADLYALRQPLSKKFTKKNPIRPFEDASSLEFFSEKNDASILLFGSSSKKRPHTVTLCRTFGGKMLDMLELYLDPNTFRTLRQFKGRKPPVGARPMVLFAGTAFENPVADEYTTARSMLLDFFRCEAGSNEDGGKVDVEGLQYIVSVSCDEPATVAAAAAAAATLSTAPVDPASKPTLRIRIYVLRTKRAGSSRLPRVELEEMGPRIDFRVGRFRQPEEALLKEAMKQGKDPATAERTKKNVSTDRMGDKLGRIHLGRQDLSDMSLRKFKGLKRSRDAVAADDDDSSGDQSGEHSGGDAGGEGKRLKV